jgi:hypothetical protein
MEDWNTPTEIYLPATLEFQFRRVGSLSFPMPSLRLARSLRLSRPTAQERKRTVNLCRQMGKEMGTKEVKGEMTALERNPPA